MLIILVLILSIVAFGLIKGGIFCYKSSNANYYDIDSIQVLAVLKIVCGALAGIAALLMGIDVFLGIYDVQCMYTIDNEIAICEEENAEINKELSTMLGGFMTYESELYQELKVNPEKAVAVVQAYPNLASSSLTDTYLQIYYDNMNQVRDLELEKIEVQATKWWLCFDKDFYTE